MQYNTSHLLDLLSGYTVYEAQIKIQTPLYTTHPTAYFMILSAEIKLHGPSVE